MVAVSMILPTATPQPPQPPWPPAQPPAHMLLQEWKYEMRREAQEIVPGVFLGPIQASTNLNRLKSMGITHILCLRDSVEARLVFPRFPTEFQYMTVDISDSEDQNLISIFPRSRVFIDEALSIGGAVLIHCMNGIATAPAIAIGYLMDKFSWEYTTALGYVQSKRYCVAPANFEIQLREYAAIAAAQKSVTGIPPSMGMHKRVWDGEGEISDRPAPGRKRALSMDGDVNME